MAFMFMLSRNRRNRVFADDKRMTRDLVMDALTMAWFRPKFLLSQAAIVHEKPNKVDS